jgi:predicted amidohydrolase YtcJ
MDGCIEPGKRADFAVLSEDPTAVSPDLTAPEDIATIAVGQLRYSALN